MFDQYTIEELRNNILNELYDIDDMIVNEMSSERKWRLNGKKEAFNFILDLLKEYE